MIIPGGTNVSVDTARTQRWQQRWWGTGIEGWKAEDWQSTGGASRQRREGKTISIILLPTNFKKGRKGKGRAEKGKGKTAPNDSQAMTQTGPTFVSLTVGARSPHSWEGKPISKILPAESVNKGRKGKG